MVYTCQYQYSESTKPSLRKTMYHNKFIFTVGIILLATMLLTSTLLAENEVEKPKELQVGMIAPSFTLKDETDTERNLNEFLGKKNVVLAFYPKDFTGG